MLKIFDTAKAVNPPQSSAENPESNAIVDTFRKDIRLEDVPALSKKLAAEILSNYQPDIIISVESGWFLPAKQIAEYIWVELHSIVIRREDIFSEAYATSTNEVQKLCLKVAQGIWFLLSKPKLFWELPHKSIIEWKKICIVDDLIHTGKTLKMTQDYLVFLGAKEIKTACLWAVGKNIPDFYLFSGHARFPWSKNSPDYPEYMRYYTNQREEDTLALNEFLKNIHHPVDIVVG